MYCTMNLSWYTNVSNSSRESRDDINNNKIISDESHICELR